MSLVEARHPADIPAVEWHVIFCPPQTTLRRLMPWPMRAVSVWMDERHRHCFALRPAQLGSILINCVGQQLFLDWLPQDPHDIARGCVAQGWAALRLDPLPWQGYPVRGVLSCVSVVKAAIGLQGALVLTPRQLYRRLLSQGAHIVTG
jgi:hypothetical protein